MKFHRKLICGLSVCLLAHASHAMTIYHKASKAKLSGNLKLENNQISSWEEEASASWKIFVPRAGHYSLVIEYAAPQNFKGTLGVKIDGRPAAMEDLPSTGGSDTFRKVVIRKVGLRGGRHTVELKALDIKGNNFINLRGFMLTDDDSGAVDLETLTAESKIKKVRKPKKRVVKKAPVVKPKSKKKAVAQKAKKVRTKKTVSSASQGKTVDLTIAKAQLTSKLKFEKGKSQIGYWDKKGTASWQVSVPSTGNYTLSLEYSTPKKLGGTLGIEIDGDLVTTEELDITGSWGKFTEASLEEIELTGGDHTITLKAEKANGSYFMNLRKVSLTGGDITVKSGGNATVKSTKKKAPRKKKKIAKKPAVQKPAADMKPVAINFKIADAKLSKKLKFEKGGSQIGYWDKNGSAAWDVTVPSAGNYSVTLEYSAPKNLGGTLGVEVDGDVVATKEIAGTGSWGKFKPATIKNVPLKAGKQTIVLKAVKAKGAYFMNLRKFSLSNGSGGGDAFNDSDDNDAFESSAGKDVALSFIKKGLPLDSAETAEAWVDAMTKAADMKMSNTTEFAEKMWEAFPLMSDWILQDNTIYKKWGHTEGYDSRGDFAEFLKSGRGLKFEQKLVKAVAKELDKEVSLPKSRKELLTLYTELCSERRMKRLAPLKAKTDEIIYATHQNMGVIYLATEQQPCPDGSELRTIKIGDKHVTDELLFDSKNGIVRDPELSFDGKKLLFAWRKTNGWGGTNGRLAPAQGNYKIYEMDLASREIRALTDDSTYGADIEPCYLPNNDIMFSSQRVVQEVTCGWGDCSNLFVMNKDGKYARRVGFDQTQTGFPHLLNDGRIIYTRRDYNDRGQSYAHALFTMNPDGTTQTEYYGNNSMAPTSIQHTRQIPGTLKTMGVAGGYHTSQGGKLVTIDPNKGRQNYDGLSFYNWEPTPLDEVNNENYCRVGEQYTYPYPLDEQSLIVSFSPLGAYALSKKGNMHRQKEQTKQKVFMRYKVYHMTLDGKREMLAADPILSATQPIPVMERKRPAVRGSLVDYTKDNATMYVQNVYYGPGSKGIKPGTIKKIRVNEIFYKPVTIGAGGWGPSRKEVGPGRKYSGYGWHSVLPAGVGSVSFDAKQILGEVDVHQDGSAMFEVPARTPIYLQMIDEKGDVVQSMRSWATLMPNETFSCVGCHEDKNSTPLQQGVRTTAMDGGPQKLKPLHNISGKPFSYPKMVQPILDKHCVSCHAPGEKAEDFDLTSKLIVDNNEGKKRNGGTTATQRKFNQSYLTLLDVKWTTRKDIKRLDHGRPNKWINYYTRMASTELLPPYYAGATKSGLLKKLRKGHAKVKLSEAELNTISAWIDLNVPYVGEYDEMNAWSPKSQKVWGLKTTMRSKQEEIEAGNIKQFINDGQPN